MTEREAITQILDAGTRAPSGSNSQPWRFKVRGNKVEVLAFPETEHKVFNYRNRGTWIALGALLENVRIASRELGFRPEIEVPPYDPATKIFANILFQKTSPETDPLYPAIWKRATNRKPYKKQPLSAAQKSELLKTAAGFNNSEFRLVDDPEAMSKLGRLMAVNEIVMLENKLLHNLFFEEIVWSRRDEEIKRSGLYLKTMELPGPVQLALRLLKHWPVMNFLNKLGLAKMVAKNNAVNYSANAAVGAIIARTDGDFVEAGELMERLWLKGITDGLSMSLVTGTLFMHQVFKGGRTEGFSEEHIRLVEDAYKEVSDCFGNPEGTITMLVRIGEGGEPSAKSSRRPIGDMVEFSG
jgi:sulfur-carrier protein adenylyltransferase/sulfurtransferase